MARAWIVLLAGCGFQSKVQTAEPPTADAAVVDGASTVPCWNLTYQNLEHLSACPASVGDPLHLIADLSINTDGGDSTPSGTRCAALASGTGLGALPTPALWRSMLIINAISESTVAIPINVPNTAISVGESWF